MKPLTDAELEMHQESAISFIAVYPHFRDHYDKTLRLISEVRRLRNLTPEERITARVEGLDVVRRLRDQLDTATKELVKSHDEVRRLREALEDYGEHDRLCPQGQAHAGRPTPDGGYETLYGYGSNERWYPRGKKPRCNCGLAAALTGEDR